MKNNVNGSRNTTRNSLYRMALNPRNGTFMMWRLSGDKNSFSVGAFVGERDEDVLERRGDRPDVSLGDAGLGERRADKIIGGALINQQVHRLAENGRGPYARQVAHGLQADGHVFAGDFDPAAIGRVDQRQVFQIVGLAANHQLGHVNVADMRATLGFIHVMGGYEQGHAGAGKFEQQIPQLAPGDRVDAGG